MPRKKKFKVNVNGVLIALGLTAVFGSHISIIAMGLPQTMLFEHSALNIIAGILITIGVLRE